MANHGPYWHTASPKSYGKLTPQVPEMLGGFCLWIHESTHFFFAGDMRGPHSDSTLKIFWILRKIESTLFFSQQKKNVPHYHSSFHSYILNLQKLWGFLGRLLSISWLNRTLVSIHRKLSDHLEKPGRLVLCKKIGSWNPESIRIHYCHALGESKQQYLGIMAGHMCGEDLSIEQSSHMFPS